MVVILVFLKTIYLGFKLIVKNHLNSTNPMNKLLNSTFQIIIKNSALKTMPTEQKASFQSSLCVGSVINSLQVYN